MACIAPAKSFTANSFNSKNQQHDTSMKLHPINHDLKSTLWCGLAALSVISGQPTSICREAVRKHVRGRDGKPALIKGISWTSLIKAAATLGYRLDAEFVKGVKNGRQPTLAQWLRQNKSLYKDKPVIVNVTGHYVTVCGRSLIDNQTEKAVPLGSAPHRRCRVKAVFAVTQTHKVVELPKPAPYVRPAGYDALRKAKILAAQHGIEVSEHANPGEYWVYPPAGFESEEHDPHYDDHLAYDRLETLKRVEEYVALATNFKAAVTAISRSFFEAPANLASFFQTVHAGPRVEGRGASASPAPDYDRGAIVEALGLKIGFHYTDGEVVGVFTKDCAVTPHYIELVTAIQEGFGPIKETVSPIKIKPVEGDE